MPTTDPTPTADRAGHVCSTAELDAGPVYVHIHTPQPDDWGISRFTCPTCERRRFMLWRHVPWYGVDMTCLRCGEQWSDGERLERPFAPRWRQRNVEAARKLYRRLAASNPEFSGGPAGR